MPNQLQSAEHNRVIEEQFTRQAERFARLHSSDDSVALLIQVSKVTPTDRVLDVACGPGLVACDFARIARQVVGIDLTPAMITLAQQKAHAAHLQNLSFHLGDVTSLPFPDASFNVTLSRYALHHMLHPAKVIAEMRRVTAPGGRIVIADVFMDTPQQQAAYDTLEKLRDPSHASALLLADLHRAFADANLTNIQQQFYRFPVEVDALLTATSTPAPEAAQFKTLLTADIPHNSLGIDAAHTNNTLTFSFPIVVLSAATP